MEESGSEHAAEERISRVVNELYRVTNETYRVRRELYLADTPPPHSAVTFVHSQPHGAHIPDDLLFFVFGFFVLGFLVERRLSGIVGRSVSDALARHVARAIAGAISGAVVTTSSESPRGQFRAGPGRGAHPTWTPHQPEQEHQDRREAASDSDSEVDWSGVRPVAPRFTLSLPHGDSLEQTRQRTADTVAAVIGWVASNLDFIPPTYPRRRPRRLPRGRPKKYKKRAQEP
ncbi:hypothetical protein M8J76_009981 [Diaphorina citri]|nr:hypothetical protein M8J75_004754 [Diaphorina citri]KAI5709092.1 hypothetical protein M8J76_009981 [Diaphorina citri]